MIVRGIRLSVSHPWGVVLLTGAIFLLGCLAYSRMQIDAYPDISAQMVQVITTYPGRAPEDVERQVTIPVEIAMRNVPGVDTIRSRTIFGLSVVQLIFVEGTESYWARQRVQEKLVSLDLPDAANPEMGPLATAYGEVLRYELVSDGRYDLMTLRTENDWTVIPRLLRVPGVAEVSNFGGYAKQFAVMMNPLQLQHYGLSVADVVTAIKSNNASAGGSVLSRGSMSFVIRGRGALQDQEEIGSIFIRSIGGTPITVGDVADVMLDSHTPTGIFSHNASDESVEGIVLLRKGENPSLVLAGVKQAIEEINAESLPEGMQIRPYYDRSQLIEATLHTVGHSVLLGISLVLLVLLVFFGQIKMAALVALTIPVALLTALMLMYISGIPIGLLSIGAIDFGILVDGAIIMAEHIARRLQARESAPASTRRTTDDVILEAATEIQRPVFFAVLMVVGAFLPLLTLTHIEGLLFRPMALTIVFALIGAILFALFALPAFAVLLFRHGYHEWQHPWLNQMNSGYEHLLLWLNRHQRILLIATPSALLMTLFFLLPRLGTEFLPYMDEGVIWVRANFPEGTSLQQTALFGKRLRELALNFDDIEFAAVQTGRNDSGTDPYPPSRIEMMLGPRERSQWTQFSRKQELVAALAQSFRMEFPTTRFNFTQPIIDSVTEDTNGTSAHMAVELSGPDSDVLLTLARQAEKLLKTVPGATDVNIEQEGPQPQLVIRPDRALCARYNVSIDEVTELIDTAIGGAPVGTIYEGERRFSIVARFAPQFIDSPLAVGRLPVYNEDGIPIPLAQVAHIDIIDGQTLIARADGRRRLTVRSDIHGRDQGGFVREAQDLLAASMSLPSGYHLTWLGMFENLQRAAGHFKWLVPASLLIIYALLLLTFSSQRAAIILMLGIPFALVGGLAALHFRGMNLNVSSGVGFAAVFGVSIMNGVLMVRNIQEFRLAGEVLSAAVIRGAVQSLKPVMMASLVAILGLLPASLASGLGSDVQRPLATVIVWGLFSSTLVTLIMVPMLYQVLPPEVEPAEEMC
ncbi:MAG: hypothetical protein RIQ52_784 [Pseudomonadota bacterium]|jgi:cobalt-zinc-cadmium resistance protein CzcA